MNEEMNNEMVNENIETEEVACVDLYPEEEKSGCGFLKLAAVTICAAGTAGAYLYKTRNKRRAKREERMVNKLLDKGYTVVYPENVKCDQTIEETGVEFEGNED